MVTMRVANHYSMEIQFINVVCLFLILIVHAEAQSKLYVHTLGSERTYGIAGKFVGGECLANE